MKMLVPDGNIPDYTRVNNMVIKVADCELFFSYEKQFYENMGWKWDDKLEILSYRGSFGRGIWDSF